MNSARRLVPRTRWLTIVAALGLVYCSANDNEISADKGAASPSWVEKELLDAGVDVITPETLTLQSEQVIKRFIRAAGRNGQDTIRVALPTSSVRSPLLGKRISFAVDDLKTSASTSFAPPVVVATEVLEFLAESEDCSQIDTLEIPLDPNALTLYIVKDLMATCTDSTGSVAIPSVSFVKVGAAGEPYTEAAMNGLDGLPVGSSLQPAPEGSECGDPGVNGLDATTQPTAENQGGSGARGAAGQNGGEVATSFFAMLGSMNTTVLFDLTGGAGGDGQDGGNGGTGGAGQDGGDASNGQMACCSGTCVPGDCTLETIVPAGQGGIGGDGGTSGDGGNGGYGGQGGSGGKGGSLVAVMEKTHFTDIDVVSTNGGVPGRGGRGGYGGTPGNAGQGGLGGWDGANCEFLAPVKRDDGQDGSSGQSGLSGARGTDGTAAERGSFVVLPYTAPSADGTPAPAP